MNHKTKNIIIVCLTVSVSVLLSLTILQASSQITLNEKRVTVSAAKPTSTFTEPTYKFDDDAKYIKEQIGFEPLTRIYYHVYDLAGGDPEKAIELFTHPDYPYNVYDYPNQLIRDIIKKRHYDPEFNVFVENKIYDYKSNSPDKIITVFVNEKYATRETYDAFEKYITPYNHMNLDIIFEKHP